MRNPRNSQGCAIPFEAIDHSIRARQDRRRASRTEVPLARDPIGTKLFKFAAALLLCGVQGAWLMFLAWELLRTFD